MCPHDHTNKTSLNSNLNLLSNKSGLKGLKKYTALLQSLFIDRDRRLLDCHFNRPSDYNVTVVKKKKCSCIFFMLARKVKIKKNLTITSHILYNLNLKVVLLDSRSCSYKFHLICVKSYIVINYFRRKAYISTMLKYLLLCLTKSCNSFLNLLICWYFTLHYFNDSKKLITRLEIRES